MEREQIEQIVRTVLLRMEPPKMESTPCSGSFAAPVEVSARHVHLSAEHVRALFGEDTLIAKHPLSQPGQFVSSKRVRLIGPKGTLEHVAVLGPTRGSTQVELSHTDARTLGVDAPLRLSGDLQGAAQIHIQAGNAMVTAPAAIVAQRHLHLTPTDADRWGISDGQYISARIEGERALSFDRVVARVSKAAALALHLDTDEANAASGITKSTVCRLMIGRCVADLPASAPSQAESTADFDGKLVTEREAVSLIARGCKVLHMTRGQLVTPLARDALRAAGVALIQEGKA